MTKSKLSEQIAEQVRRALAEDIGDGDLTASLVAAGAQLAAHIVCREPAVVCGCAWVDEVYAQIDRSVALDWRVQDGDSAAASTHICLVRGPARSVLTGERTALNFLQLLSGTATRTAQFVRAVRDTQTRILDTRKTVPGLRIAQKYAVRCGGGLNHRMGLYDAILIKENHIAAAGSIGSAVQAAKHIAEGRLVEVEVEDLTQLTEAIEAGAGRVLLDNFSLDGMRAAVAAAAGRVELEASGGITLASVRDIALTGVDFISVGSLTKDVSAVDLSMRFVV